MLANRDVKATVRGTPDRPDDYFTHASTAAGSLQNTPRSGKDVIHETPMYQRSGSSFGQTREAAPTPPQAHQRVSYTQQMLAQQQQQQQYQQANTPPPAAPARQNSGGFSLNRKNAPEPPQGMALKRASGITTATVAGEANRQGGVYDRLSSKKTFTGVYAKRFDTSEQGGRINGDTVNGRANGYKGDTNTGTNQRIDDISQILRR